MFEAIAPFINDILLALAGLFSTVILAIFAELRTRVLDYFDSRNDLRHQQVIMNIAKDAFSYAEQTLKGSEGQAKLDSAIGYATRQLALKGIVLDEQEVLGSIERAVLEYNQLQGK